MDVTRRDTGLICKDNWGWTNDRAGAYLLNDEPWISLGQGKCQGWVRVPAILGFSAMAIKI